MFISPPNMSFRTPSQTPKRSRTGEMRPAADVRNTLRAASQTGPMGIGITSKKVDDDGDITKAKACSTGDNPRYWPVSPGFIEKMFFPRFKYSYTGYGQNMGVVQEQHPVLIGNTANELTTGHYWKIPKTQLAEPKGLWTSCQWPNGRQYWFESVAMPLFKKMTNASQISVFDLIRKGQDSNLHSTIFNTFLQGHITDDQYAVASDGTFLEASPELKIMDALRIDYFGGTQTHKWTNYGVADVTFTIWEVSPRRPQQGYVALTGLGEPENVSFKDPTTGTDGYYAYKPDYIHEKLYFDMIDQVPPSNDYFPHYDLNMVNSKNDIGFGIKPGYRRFHYHYKCSTPVKVTIKPGGTFTYEMKIPPFQLNGGEMIDYLTVLTDTTAQYQQKIGANPMDASQSVRNTREQLLPTHFPKFTKILVGAITGELGMRQRTQNEVGGDSGTLGQYISSSIMSSGKLSHTMEEYHDWRCVPFHKENNYVKVNYLDTNPLASGGANAQVFVPFQPSDVAGQTIASGANIGPAGLTTSEANLFDDNVMMTVVNNNISGQTEPYP